MLRRYGEETGNWSAGNAGVGSSGQDSGIDSGQELPDLQSEGIHGYGKVGLAGHGGRAGLPPSERRGTGGTNNGGQSRRCYFCQACITESSLVDQCRRQTRQYCFHTLICAMFACIAPGTCRRTYLYFLTKVTITGADPDKPATVLVPDIEAGQVRYCHPVWSMEQVTCIGRFWRTEAATKKGMLVCFLWQAQHSVAAAAGHPRAGGVHSTPVSRPKQCI